MHTNEDQTNSVKQKKGARDSKNNFLYSVFFWYVQTVFVFTDLNENVQKQSKNILLSVPRIQ